MSAPRGSIIAFICTKRTTKTFQCVKLLKRRQRTTMSMRLLRKRRTQASTTELAQQQLDELQRTFPTPPAEVEMPSMDVEEGGPTAAGIASLPISNPYTLSPLPTPCAEPCPSPALSPDECAQLQNTRRFWRMVQLKQESSRLKAALAILCSTLSMRYAGQLNTAGIQRPTLDTATLPIIGLP